MIALTLTLAVAMTLGLGSASQTPSVLPASQPPTPPSKQSVEQELAPQLLSVRRIFVDSFGDEPIARQLRDMIIAGLAESKKFVLTENKERTDAVLKGTALEKTSQEARVSSEFTLAGRAAIQDSSAKTETINDARAAVRLVSRDGDVIWSTTQESRGAK